MKISILGSTSFLAGKLIEVLSKIDIDQVQNYCRNPQGEEQQFSFPHHGIEQLNINELLASDIIIYTAGAGIQPKHSDNESVIFEINAYEPIRLIQTLTHHAYQGKLITFGSYFEIGNSSSNLKYDEKKIIGNQNTKPNAYVSSKSLLSYFILNHLQSYNLNLMHLILPNIYGVGENKNRLFPYIADSIRNSIEMIFTSGNQSRQFLHISDVAQFVLAQLSNKSSGIYNLGSNCLTVKTIIEESIKHLEDKLGVKAIYSFTEIQKRDSSMQHLELEDQKARSELGWNPTTSIQKGILEY